MKALDARLNELMGAGLDISHHLGFLLGLAMRPNVKRIVEIGFRDGVSATALARSGKELRCYDVEKCSTGRKKLASLAPNFSFEQADSLKVTIPACDLLHIDSLHTHDHLLAELRRHAGQCSTFIALHDTQTFGEKGKDGSEPGLKAAIETFLKESDGEWTLYLHLPNNNGMTLLLRRTLSTPQSPPATTIGR
jgi:cephalosporin hydroxylase